MQLRDRHEFKWTPVRFALAISVLWVGAVTFRYSQAAGIPLMAVGAVGALLWQAPQFNLRSRSKQR
jgi:hypothetical protein